MKAIKTVIKGIPVFKKLANKLATVLHFQRGTWSKNYWEMRYARGGNSGSGSYNRLATFKAEVLNLFVEKHNIHSVIEFGCGDGNQLSLANYRKYIGIDVSPTIIEKCKRKFASDDTKEFFVYHPDMLKGNASRFQSELSLSIDVIFHVVEDRMFEIYMSDLFKYASKYVIVYSSNHDSNHTIHVKHRKFSAWVERNKPNWELVQKIENKYKFDPEDPDNTSFCDFYIFQKLA
ncbi:class I SAM-dependent methyltransferase [Pontibacter ruber]|uniref:Methyltransferase domain-containing protein n=1 Tax=Pontibacter ruber TaxID=1343895 RepID=A0ABW5CV68_9BACT|nr:class I SAM-dependent methyltransferase [Pontibacter ruber]